MTVPSLNAKHQPCLLCGSRDLALSCAMSLQDKYTCEVTTCRRCGLAFVNPVLTPAQLQDLYDGDYWGAAEHGLREAQRDFPRQYRVGRAYGRRLARASATGRMLEIGCGLPFFLRGVADNCAWEIEGLDPADGVGEFSQAKLGLQVHQGRFDGEAFPAEAYDLVRAKDVLEHVLDPLEFLRGIHRVLRPGGRVELWVPNGPIDLIAARRAFKRGGMVRLDAGHVLFISPRVLARMLEATGFRVERAEVFSFRPALKALVGWRDKRRKIRQARTASGKGRSLGEWERPPQERGFKGTMLYARLREWRFHRPSVPAWLPLGLRQWVIARKQ